MLRPRTRGQHRHPRPPAPSRPAQTNPTAPAAAAHRFYKNWYRAKKKAFSKYAKKYTDGKKSIEAELAELKKHCCAIRVLAHTQIRKLGFGQKKAHLIEVQVNGGTVEKKVDYAYSMFEKQVRASGGRADAMCMCVRLFVWTPRWTGMQGGGFVCMHPCCDDCPTELGTRSPSGGPNPAAPLAAHCHKP